MLDKYASILLMNRWKVLAAWLIVIAACFVGITKISFSSDYRVFFGDDNPELLAFNKIQDTFDSSDNVFIAIENKDASSVFSPNSLLAMQNLTKELWNTPNSTRVDSLTNYQYSYAAGDELLVDDLVAENQLSSEAIAIAKKRALNEKTLVNKLVSKDGSIGAINITIKLPGIMREAEVPEVGSYINKVIDQAKQDYPDLNFYATGQIMMNNTLVEASQYDLGVLFPITLLVIIIGTALFVKGISATVGVFMVIIFSLITALGITGWLGIQMTPPSATAPTIILTLVVADCMHILSSYFYNLRSGLSKIESMEQSIVLNFKAISITTLTTVLGFLTLNFSDSPPFQDLGNITAFGVIAAYLLSISLLPAITTLLPARSKQSTTKQASNISRYVDFIKRNTKSLMLVLFSVTLFMAWALPKNIIDDNFYDYFGESFATRQANDYIFENLTGIATLEYEISSQEKMGITEPEFLNKVDAFSKWFESQPETYNVSVLTETFKRLNKNMHQENPDWFKLPEDKALAAQYLLLYELSLPYGLSLDNQVSFDKSSLRMVVTLRKGPSSQLIRLNDDAQNWLSENNMSSMVSTGVSPDMMFAKIGHRNNRTLLWGALIALVVISFTLIAVFKDAKIGLLSLIPNLYPAGIAFAIWGIAIGEVGLSLSVVGTMTLGIVVDDTVHFLNKYMHATRKLGRSSVQALAYTFETVGPAILGTTLVLALGFLVLATSPFRLNSDMGLMTAITIVIALILDFLILPALLLIFDKFEKPSMDEQPAVTGLAEQN